MRARVELRGCGVGMGDILSNNSKYVQLRNFHGFRRQLRHAQQLGLSASPSKRKLKWGATYSTTTFKQGAYNFDISVNLLCWQLVFFYAHLKLSTTLFGDNFPWRQLFLWTTLFAYNSFSGTSSWECDSTTISRLTGNLGTFDPSTQSGASSYIISHRRKPYPLLSMSIHHRRFNSVQLAWDSWQ